MGEQHHSHTLTCDFPAELSLLPPLCDGPRRPVSGLAGGLKTVAAGATGATGDVPETFPGAETPVESTVSGYVYRRKAQGGI